MRRRILPGRFFAVLISTLFLAFPAATVVAQQAKDQLLGAKQRYDALRSYQCKATNVVMKYGFIKDARYTNKVTYSFEKPDRVRMTWLEPFLLKGQIAVFRDKQLKVKMRFMPFAIAMNPDGFLAQDPAGNRIYHTNIGYLLETLLAAITPETRVWVEQSGPVIIQNDQGRVLIVLDKQSGLPVSIEYYGPEGKLQQACYFEDIKINVAFGPDEFDLAVSAGSG